MSFKHAGQLDIYEHLLFELRMPLSGLLASGGRIEERERVPREITRLVWTGSGAVSGSVCYSGDS
jgi:hypothetical protein